ncbi:MAG: DUF1186 domain-containing protein [Rhodoblastus sp.]|uniref:DUF1186 domain-containing protein n=1 Tax=Rhodoblastus sp. TaxID=1962975 RepID=UPI003F947BC7
MNLVEMALADLAGAETFPLDAILTLRQKWALAREPLLASLNACASGVDRTPENAETVFFALHLLAEKRETEAFAPLVSMALEGDQLYEIIGDATTETLPQIFLSLYDGDLEKLKGLIAAPGADPWARVAALEAYSYLAASGEIPLDDARKYFAELFETLQPRSADPVWFGWQNCIALLGFADLEPLVVRAFRQGLVDKQVLAFEDFQVDLFANRAAPDRRALCEERGLKPIDDALEALAVFDADEDEDDEPSTPAANPNRNVGRNDPCPCGSGKKYKKCCLETE